MTNGATDTKKDEQSLNRQNLPWLATVLIVNAVIFYVLIVGKPTTLKELGALLKDWQSLLPATLGAIVVGVLTSQFSEQTRARLVFWRWRNPLPGCRAFSEYGPRDYRIKTKMDILRTACGGTLPSDPDEQNTTWFLLYRKVDSNLRVKDAHRNYLFYRDYAAMSVLFIIAFGGSGFLFIPAAIVAGVYFLALVAQYALVCRAAQRNAIAFVTNVLAEIVAGKPQ